MQIKLNIYKPLSTYIKQDHDQPSTSSNISSDYQRLTKILENSIHDNSLALRKDHKSSLQFVTIHDYSFKILTVYDNLWQTFDNS